MTVLFKCGHNGQVKDGEEPRCACGETRVFRSNAKAPRFVGTATGPHVTTRALDPATPTIGDARLSLKGNTE